MANKFLRVIIATNVHARTMVRLPAKIRSVDALTMDKHSTTDKEFQKVTTVTCAHARQVAKLPVTISFVNVHTMV